MTLWCLKNEEEGECGAVARAISHEYFRRRDKPSGERTLTLLRFISCVDNGRKFEVYYAIRWGITDEASARIPRMSRVLSVE